MSATPLTAQLAMAKAEEKLRTRFADHAKHIKIQMLLINQLILKLGNRYRYRCRGEGRERPLSQLQLNATECDNKIIRHRHLETISISHKKSRRRRRGERNSCYLFGLFCGTSAAKLAFWQWNANVAGNVELPSSVSQFLRLSFQPPSSLSPVHSSPHSGCGFWRVVVVLSLIWILCARSSSRGSSSKKVNFHRLICQARQAPRPPLPPAAAPCIVFMLLHFWQVPPSPPCRLLVLANFEMWLP